MKKDSEIPPLIPKLSLLVPVAQHAFKYFNYNTEKHGCVIGVCLCKDGQPMETHTIYPLKDWAQSFYLLSYQAHMLKDKEVFLSRQIVEHPDKSGASKLGGIAFVTIGLDWQHNCILSALMAEICAHQVLNGESAWYLNNLYTAMKITNLWNTYQTFKADAEKNNILVKLN